MKEKLKCAAFTTEGERGVCARALRLHLDSISALLLGLRVRLSPPIFVRVLVRRLVSVVAVFVICRLEERVTDRFKVHPAVKCYDISAAIQTDAQWLILKIKTYQKQHATYVLMQFKDTS